MTIKKFTFGPFGTNTYVISCPLTGKECPEGEKGAILVDCACWDWAEQEQLADYLQRAGLTPTLLVCTHGHLDHLWGAKWACETYGLTAYIHPDDYEQVEHLAQQQAAFGILQRDTDFPYAALREMAGWEILHTPGHTRGSVCLYNEAEALLLSGDTLFDGGYGRTDLPGGNFHQLTRSLERLEQLPRGTRVLPGHGGEFKI